MVITAPTGSGKSTQVPRWCAEQGHVLVVEPRRVACRGLADHVARLENTPLGKRVGYAVRDDYRSDDKTTILFATPGVVLGWLARDSREGSKTPLRRFASVVLDEFHERRLDVELILALLLSRYQGALVIMSATMDAKAVAEHVDGQHLQAGGRLYPVTVSHLKSGTFLPEPKGLEDRVVTALKKALKLQGDVLVFLPGKAEIARCQQAAERIKEYECLAVHGGLTLKDQSRVFEPGKKRRIILSTNVAETSITIPTVGVVVDSGLVRRTRYHNGRGYLTLVPIALDSAEQRAGRAGRTGPGTCFRLWDSGAILSRTTPPEIRRESLVPLVLAAAACGEKPEALPFLEPPADYALESARDDLLALGAISESGEITQRGTELFSLPLDPFLGALLVEGERLGLLDEAVDLVGAISVGRPMFVAQPKSEDDKDKLGLAGCDGQALVRAVREGEPGRHGLSRFVLQEARSTAKRLRTILTRTASQPTQARPGGQELSRRLAQLVLAADPRGAYIARRRKKGVFWSNGGTEVLLARESFLDEEKVDALAALDVRGLGQGHRKTSLIVTRAIPMKIKWLVEAAVGQREVARADVQDGNLVAIVNRVYAGKVIARDEEEPRGELAREAFCTLFMEGRLFKKARETAEDRLSALSLCFRLVKSGMLPPYLDASALAEKAGSAVPSLQDWTMSRLEAVGFDRGNDLALLSESDLVPTPLPAPIREWLDRQFPRTVDLSDALYKATYDLGRRVVTLQQMAGQRKNPPTAQMLPGFSGFGIKVKSHSRTWVVR